jgi:hypothetical protein
MQLWRSAEAFVDLPRSVLDTGCHISMREGYDTEKAFWQQFKAPSHLELLNNHMKQLMELLRMAKSALQDLRINLWPAKALPTSLFGLLAQLQEACPKVAHWKRSTCLEGVQRAYARVKMHYPHVEVADVAVGPPKGRTEPWSSTLLG